MCLCNADESMKLESNTEKYGSLYHLTLRLTTKHLTANEDGRSPVHCFICLSLFLPPSFPLSKPTNQFVF